MERRLLLAVGDVITNFDVGFYPIEDIIVSTKYIVEEIERENIKIFNIDGYGVGVRQLNQDGTYNPEGRMYYITIDNEEKRLKENKNNQIIKVVGKLYREGNIFVKR